ncbi:hypothetical protein DCAR_0518745 [Daucus carota subsp. sativus]|uniref:Uncharacterized protein n=1 Tax=Daucus carota subsp. sativus TaxID=79200 RepID=A0A164XGB5_DAUCS|nr:PREDICTED: protein SHOOT GRAVITROPISM 5-like [Daucus carota subsp. sativus]WOG99397.1 hypothetical protein DCAR_0518745 [Daucus carota subsp. sativus]
MEEDHKELQLLPTPRTIIPPSPSRIPRWPLESKARSSKDHHMHNLFEGPSLDLQLSISLRPFRPPETNNSAVLRPVLDRSSHDIRAETLKWQASEQIRLAALEKAYAERVRELTRREMELAQSEFSRARLMWERAREEVEKAEKLKERAVHRIDPMCMEVTCQACRQKFRS